MKTEIERLKARVNNFENEFEEAERITNDNWAKIEQRGQQASDMLSRLLARALGCLKDTKEAL